MCDLSWKMFEILKHFYMNNYDFIPEKVTALLIYLAILLGIATGVWAYKIACK